MTKNISNAFNPIKTHIQQLGLPQSIAEIILDESFVQRNPSYYLAYASLFSEAFTIRDEQFLKTLNIAGFLYYRFIIINDHFIDKKTIDDNLDYHAYQLAALTCHEESIKMLCSLFTYPSSFWEYWSLRKKEYLWAVKTEKETKDSLTANLFEKLADAKSAFGKIAIDALYLGAGKEYTYQYNNLIQSHIFFSQAFQILDDVLDLKEDLLNEQPNYALCKVKEFLKKEEINVDQTNSALIEKYLHVSGISVELLENAISYNEKASLLIENINVSNWKSVLAQQKFMLKALKSDYQVYVRYVEAKIKHSRQFNNPALTLKNAIKLAVNYVTGNFNKNRGTWDEYITNGNISSIWATAFISNQLVFLNAKEIETCKTKAAHFLNTRKDTLWGYNSQMPCDADSTNFALLALMHQNYEIDKAIASWLSFQNSDGGFATYTSNQTTLLNKIMYNGNSSISYEGWEQSHPCVSAVSLLLLAYHQDKYQQPFKQLKSYLKKEFKEHQSFKPYWWTSEIYSLSYLSGALVISKDEDLSAMLQQRVQAVIKNQNLDGSFGDAFQPNSSFYTALMLQILCEHSEFIHNYGPNLEKALQWLLKNQFTDGSWDNTYALRLPAINILDPETATTRWPAKRNGLNTRAIEFNRLFSTATALKALNSYLKNLV